MLQRNNHEGMSLEREKHELRRIVLEDNKEANITANQDAEGPSKLYLGIRGI